MSDSTTYVVQRGDSLTKIAAAHGTTTTDIASLNQLTNINRIAVGQRLRLPRPGLQQAKATVPAAPSVKPAAERSLILQFVDALNCPISALKVRLEHSDHQVEHTTDSQGKVPAFAIDGASEAKTKISVEKLAGEWKEVAQITPTSEATYVRLRSPKVALDSSMRPHEGGAVPATAKKQEPLQPGTVIETRSPAGNPVQQITMECPNPQNLRLASNSKYREVLLAASERSGLPPQSISAIMNAEAAKISVTHHEPILDKKTGKQAIGKDGKPRFRKYVESTGEWNSRSAAPSSSARGMTQFLDASWISLALSSGTFLNARVKKEGWLTTGTISKVVKTKQGKKTIQTTVQQSVPAFKLSDGSLVTKAPLAITLSRHPYLTDRATASDGNLQRLLDLRYEAEYSINTAVDYGLQNLDALQAAGFPVANLNTADKAKIIYLAHHLGSSDARLFIDEKISEEHAQMLLEQQIGESQAESMADVEGSYLKAHRTWLTNYIDNKVVVNMFACQKNPDWEAKPVADIIKGLRSGK